MADHLAKGRLPHPAACPLCHQVDESIQLMLITCVFAHQVWCIILQRLGSTVCNQILKLVVSGNQRSSQGDQEGAQLSHYSSVLGDWKHRNDCMFTNISMVLQAIANKFTLWCSDEAKALQEMVARLFIGS